MHVCLQHVPYTPVAVLSAVHGYTLRLSDTLCVTGNALRCKPFRTTPAFMVNIALGIAGGGRTTSVQLAATNSELMVAPPCSADSSKMARAMAARRHSNNCHISGLCASTSPQQYAAPRLRTCVNHLIASPSTNPRRNAAAAMATTKPVGNGGASEPEERVPAAVRTCGPCGRGGRTSSEGCVHPRREWRGRAPRSANERFAGPGRQHSLLPHRQGSRSTESAK